MIVVGIDYQPVHTAVCVREGRAPGWPPVSVGDGRRALIANAIAGSAWSGDALGYPLQERHWAGSPLRPGPWIDAPGAPLFWAGLRARLKAFLGGQTASLRATVVESSGDPYARARVVDLASGAGFINSTCLLSGRAALTAALYGGETVKASTQTLLFAVIGACQTEVFAYRLEWRRERPWVVAASRPIVITSAGEALWCRQVVHAVKERCPEGADDRRDGLLWPAAAEMSACLTAAEDDAEVLEWSGPLRDQMPAPPQFSRAECYLWDSVVRLDRYLSEALAHAAREVSNPAPASVLLAGPGARWPFAARAAAPVAPVSTLDAPELALARGAAWWPDFAEPLFLPDLADEQTPLLVESLRLEPPAHSPHPSAGPFLEQLGEPGRDAASERDSGQTLGEDWGLLRGYVDPQGDTSET